VDSFVGNYYTGGNNEVGFALTSYGQQFATVDSRLAGIDSTLINHEDRIASLEGWQAVAKGQFNDLYNRSSKAYEGVAIALASQQFTLETGKRFGVSGNFGTFEGQSALAASAAIRLSHDWQINAGVGFGTNQGTVGGRVGVVGQW
jgi:hypothetical protein